MIRLVAILALFAGALGAQPAPPTPHCLPLPLLPDDLALIEVWQSNTTPSLVRIVDADGRWMILAVWPDRACPIRAGYIFGVQGDPL